MRKAGVAKTKARPTSFFFCLSHKTWKLPSSIPSPTESKITAVYIHLSSTQHFLIRLSAGTHKAAVPTTHLHVVSSQNTARPQEFMCELR